MVGVGYERSNGVNRNCISTVFMTVFFLFCLFTACWTGKCSISNWVFWTVTTKSRRMGSFRSDSDSQITLLTNGFLILMPHHLLSLPHSSHSQPHSRTLRMSGAYLIQPYRCLLACISTASSRHLEVHPVSVTYKYIGNY